MNADTGKKARIDYIQTSMEQLIEEFDRLDAEKQLLNFIHLCRRYTKDNPEKCDHCNLRFKCYTEK